MVTTTIIIITVVGLLVGPTSLLWDLSEEKTNENKRKAIGTISGFALLFSLVLYIYTKAKRHEMLSATAA